MKYIIYGCIIAISCTYNPYKSTNKIYRKESKHYGKQISKAPLVPFLPIDSIHQSSYWVGTTNFNLRRPNFVIIHHTAQDSFTQTLKAFTVSKSEVSAHYLISRDGTVFHLLNDYLRAWQAGVASWGNCTDINSISVGIELDNNGFEPFSDVQINSLLHVLQYLKITYRIPASHFIGHLDIAPKRKNDPSIFFPWNLLATHGFGIWYDSTAVAQDTNTAINFNPYWALRIIGYSIQDTTATIHAFNQHFLQDTSSCLTPMGIKVLRDITENTLYIPEKK